MNTRLTLLLASVLALLMGGVWYMGNTPASPSGTATVTGGPTLINAAADDITEIDVQSGGQQVTMRRTDSGEWSYATGGSGQFGPADTQRIRSLATRLAGMKAQSIISEQPDAAALKEYGLDSPAAYAVVKTKAGDTTVFIGPDNPRRTGKYVRMGNNGPVYLAEGFLFEDLVALAADPPVPPTPTPAPTATPASAAQPTATAIPAGSSSPPAGATETPAP